MDDVQEAAARLNAEIEDRWACADGPKRAWFEIGGERHVYHVLGFVAMGHGEEQRRLLSEHMLKALHAVNTGGLLVFRRRPEIMELNAMPASSSFGRNEGTPACTRVTVRLAFVGGTSHCATESSSALIQDGAGLAGTALAV